MKACRGNLNLRGGRSEICVYAGQYRKKPPASDYEGGDCQSHKNLGKKTINSLVSSEFRQAGEGPGGEMEDGS